MQINILIYNKSLRLVANKNSFALCFIASEIMNIEFRHTIVRASILLVLVFSDQGMAATPRAYLQTDPGYIKPDTLHIGDKTHKTSNFLMSTFEISEFEYLKESDPNAYQALWNHDRYGIVGTRGLLIGIGVSATTVLVFKDAVHPAVPITTFLAGFIYYMNCRYMARHYLHNAINTLNGVAPPKRSHHQWSFSPMLIAQSGDSTFGVTLSGYY